MKNLYRYTAISDGDEYKQSLLPVCEKIPVIRETKCGYWIESKYSYNAVSKKFETGERWISKCGKQAQETKEEALANFLARRLKTIWILKWRIELGEELVEVIKEHIKNGTTP